MPVSWTPTALLARGRHLLCRTDHILKTSCSATRNHWSGRQLTVRLSLCWRYSPTDRLLLHSNRRSNTHVQNSSAPLSLPTAPDTSCFEAYTSELRNCRKGAASMDKSPVCRQQRCNKENRGTITKQTRCGIGQKQLAKIQTMYPPMDVERSKAWVHSKVAVRKPAIYFR